MNFDTRTYRVGNAIFLGVAAIFLLIWLWSRRPGMVIGIAIGLLPAAAAIAVAEYKKRRTGGSSGSRDAG